MERGKKPSAELPLTAAEPSQERTCQVSTSCWAQARLPPVLNSVASEPRPGAPPVLGLPPPVS